MRQDRTRPIIAILGLLFLVGADAIAGPCIEFTILSIEDSTGIPGATVILSPKGPGGAADLEGKVVLCPKEPASYRYTASSIGFDSDSGSVLLPSPEGFVTVTVYLEPVTGEGELVTVVGEKLHRTGDWEGAISGKDLERLRGGTVAETLDDLPGFATYSTGPITGQIVSRGVTGDRVTLTLDGSAAPDASSLAPDHAVTVTPGLARRISIQYGPKSFLHSSAPIGGVIDVESGSEYQSGRFGGFSSLRAESGAETIEGTIVGMWRPSTATSFELFGTTRHSDNQHLSDNSTLPNSGGSVSQAGARAGMSAGPFRIRGGIEHYRSDYGIPPDPDGPHPEGVDIEMRRTTGRASLGLKADTTGSSEHVLQVIGTEYHHREIESAGITGVEFGLAETAVTWRADFGDPSQEDVKLLTHSGYTFQNVAANGLRLAPSQRHEFFGAIYTELELASTTLSGSLRYDQTITGQGEKDSESRNLKILHGGVSGSAGLVQHVNASTAIGLTAMTTFRPPDIRELLSEGPHAAARAFEIGNRELESERGIGGDIFMHGAVAWFDGEIRLFVNDFSRYLIPVATGDTNRLSGLPIYRVSSPPARFAGVEVDIEALLFSESVRLSTTLEHVHATFGHTAEALPRIPPLTLTTAVEYRSGGFAAILQAVTRARQTRTGEFESPTPGSTLLDCNLQYRFFVGATVHAINVSGSNLLDTLWYDHLSLFRDLYPGPGLSVNLQYQVYL